MSKILTTLVSFFFKSTDDELARLTMRDVTSGNQLVMSDWKQIFHVPTHHRPTDVERFLIASVGKVTLEM